MARGHAKETWELTPSLSRHLKSGVPVEEALAVERRALDVFKSMAHTYLPVGMIPANPPWASSMLEWWALMQHYQAPTRLLDWTSSLFVAAYFASYRHWDLPGAIYVFHFGAVLDQITKRYGARANATNDDLCHADSPPSIHHFSPMRRSERLVAQQGSFTVSLNVLGSQATTILDACTEAAALNRSRVVFQIRQICALSQDVRTTFREEACMRCPVAKALAAVL